MFIENGDGVIAEARLEGCQTAGLQWYHTQFEHARVLCVNADCLVRSAPAVNASAVSAQARNRLSFSTSPGNHTTEDLLAAIWRWLAR